MRISPLLTLLVLLALSGCSGCSIGYYAQAIEGHFELMGQRRDIDEVIADPTTDVEVRDALLALGEARVFAREQLSLPDNDSYTTYAETGRDAVTWNVVAAEAFSLNPKTWCFPVAGCVSYRGYFDRSDADAYAARLAAEGYDVTVGGASAYSTLGWFRDPVLDTTIRGSVLRPIGTLFHELAHQQLYVKDDSAFNEAFASFVEQQALRQWLVRQQDQEGMARYEASLQRAEQFSRLLADTRDELLSIYASDIDQEQMAEQKARAFERMRANYAALKVSWAGYSGYDNWFSRELNNARLVSVATYRKWVPAFAAIYRQSGNDMAAFFSAVEALAAKPREERDRTLQALIDQAA